MALVESPGGRQAPAALCTSPLLRRRGVEELHKLTITSRHDPRRIQCVSKQIEELLKEYDLDDDTYQKIQQLLLKEMQAGLCEKSNPTAKVKMFPTYVRALPDGTEKGDFLALDLGGTNFRVLLITLDGSRVSMKNKIYPIAESTMHGTGAQLFDHIAGCIANFMTEYDLPLKHPNGHKTPLGFTFSFPCRQMGLAIGKLVTWTKGFKCSGVEGEDVVRLLDEAIARRGDLEVECVALLNDTVGCLMSCAFLDHNTEVGVILGTGTNACYMERLDRVEMWDEDKEYPSQVVINTEWGAFGDNGVLDFIRTEVDRDIDSKSLNPGKQIYEKMISGMYMGEIAGRVILSCAEKGLLFDGDVPTKLAEKPSNFFTKYVSEVEKDNGQDDFPNTRQVLDELFIDDPTRQDCANVHYICTLVSRRAAYLASAGIATLLNRIDKPQVTVAVDGSLYRFHPHFHSLMMDKTRQLLAPGLKFGIRLSEDGSGRGAALVAAVAARMRAHEGQSKATSAMNHMLSHDSTATEENHVTPTHPAETLH